MLKLANRRERATRDVLIVESLESRSMLAVAILSAVQDTTLYEELEQESVTANGAGRSMFVGTNDMAKERRALVKFDIADEIPAGAKIRTVDLKLTATSSGVEAQDISLYRITSDWGEGTSAANPGDDGTTPSVDSATWNFRRYGVSPTRWNTPGGDYDGDFSAELTVEGPGTYTVSDVGMMIEDVTDWLSDSSLNHGWLLLGDNTSSDAVKRFDTREGTTGPQLIVDYEPPDVGEISIMDATDSEGNASDSNTLSFEVTISRVTLKPVTVNYTTAIDDAGTHPASEDDDFTPQSGQLTFAMGQPTTQRIEIPIVGDEIDEEDETFLVRLSDLQGEALISRGEATGTILDDDPLPTVEIAGGEFDEGDEGSINYGLTVTLSEPSGKTVVVQYEHQDEGATWQEDYETVLPAVVTFAPGVTEQALGIRIIGDTEDESNEEFLIKLLDPTNAELGEASTARVTILDDEENVATPWHNSDLPEDVGGDGNVIPLDALLVINAINSGGSGPLAPPTEPGVPPPFLDVSADNFLSPFDALLVINYLNNPPVPAVAEAEDASLPGPLDDALLRQIAASTLANRFQLDDSDGAARAKDRPA